MRICVFSDIHGNAPAFFSALKLIRTEAADAHIFLGDLCGYYFDQLEVLDALTTLPGLISIQGNHDRMFMDIVRGDESLRADYLERYGPSMEILLEKDYTGLLDWLTPLPESFLDDTVHFTCFHGSPGNPLDGYIYPDTEIDWGENSPGRFVFLGHTHYRMIRNASGRIILNPGSIGQPRDGNPPSYAVVDWPEAQVVFKNVVWNSASFRKDLINLAPEHTYLRSVIERRTT